MVTVEFTTEQQLELLRMIREKLDRGPAIGEKRGQRVTLIGIESALAKPKPSKHGFFG